MNNTNSLKVAVSNHDLKALKTNVSAKLANVVVEEAIEKNGKAVSCYEMKRQNLFLFTSILKIII